MPRFSRSKSEAIYEPIKSVESFSTRSPLNIFYLQNFRSQKSPKLILGDYKVGLSILPQSVCLKLEKKLNFIKHFSETLQKIPVISTFAVSKKLPKIGPSVSQTF